MNSVVIDKNLNPNKNEYKRKELGATLTEYRLLVAMILVVCIPSIYSVGDKVNKQFCITLGKMEGHEIQYIDHECWIQGDDTFNRLE